MQNFLRDVFGVFNLQFAVKLNYYRISKHLALFDQYRRVLMSKNRCIKKSEQSPSNLHRMCQTDTLESMSKPRRCGAVLELFEVLYRGGVRFSSPSQSLAG